MTNVRRAFLSCISIAIVDLACCNSASAPPPPLSPAISVTISPTSATLEANGTQAIGATLVNDTSNKGVTWTVSCQVAACGSVSPTSTPSETATIYTAPATPPASNLPVTITAISVSDSTKTASATFTVEAISVSLNPTTASLQVSTTLLIAATASYDPRNGGVTWSIGGCTGGASVCGSLENTSSSGATYAAPATIPPGTKVSVVARSVSDTTKSASATISIIVLPTLNFVSQNYAAGNSPDGIVLADFNGDGKLDVAVADYGDPATADNGGVSLLLGNGDGTFQPATLISAGNNPISIAVGDFNNDGHQDLVVSDYGNRSSGGNGSVSVLVGNGDGTFEAPVTLTAGNEPFGLAASDFNGDGKLDFVVTDYDSGVYVFLGNGDGTFQSLALVSTGNSPSAIAARDFNGDGKLDLAVAGSPQSGGFSIVSILLGNGDGTFQSPVPYNVTDWLLTSIATGDISGDGRIDLAITWSGCVFGLCKAGITTLLGNGDGTLEPAQTPWWVYSQISLSAQIADLASDGKADLVQINETASCPPGGPCVVVLPGNGEGTFEAPVSFGADQNPSALTIRDLNGDGKPDIVVANQGSNDITVLLNETTPQSEHNIVRPMRVHSNRPFSVSSQFVPVN
jgi:hypothetical protein